MFGSAYRALKLRERAAKLPTRTVSPEEFIACAIRAGMTPEKAKHQLMVCRSFGSSAMIGDEMLEIAEPEE